MLVGPNTFLAHSSVVFMIESQINYVLDCLRLMEQRQIAAIEVRPQAQAAFNAEVQTQMRGTVWDSGGCASWYLDASGRNSTLWPAFTWRVPSWERSTALAASRPRRRARRSPRVTPTGSSERG